MNPSTKTWIGQVTTGHAFMVLAPTLLAVLSGTMSWQLAFPLVVAGAVGLVWPENTALKDAAQTAAADLETAFARYQGGLAKAAANMPVPPDPRPGATGFAVLAAVGLSLAACVGQTPAQQAAAVQAIECIANATAKIAMTDAMPTPIGMKIANAVLTVGSELAADPACGSTPIGAPVVAKP